MIYGKKHKDNTQLLDWNPCACSSMQDTSIEYSCKANGKFLNDIDCGVLQGLPVIDVDDVMFDVMFDSLMERLPQRSMAPPPTGWKGLSLS